MNDFYRGLKWRKVEYQDNTEVINLVESKPKGVFSLLDEGNEGVQITNTECVVPRGSDKTFCTKLMTNHMNNSRLSAPSISKKQKSK